MLFPIKIVLSIFEESEMTFSSIFAFRFPCSARDWIRILFTVVRDVSAEEKNADSKSKNKSVAICIASLESNKNHSFFNMVNPVKSFYRTQYTWFWKKMQCFWKNCSSYEFFELGAVHYFKDVIQWIRKIMKWIYGDRLLPCQIGKMQSVFVYGIVIYDEVNHEKKIYNIKECG